MERATSLIHAKEIMGPNFIGHEEISSIKKSLGICVPPEIFQSLPPLPFSEKLLKSIRNDYILILGMPYYKDGTKLTLVKMREHFGWDPLISEPCFYNQDWYLKERFANDAILKLNWYLLSKNMFQKSRGKSLDQINMIIPKNQQFPSAILCAYLFFSYHLITRGKILWQNDYLWCSDTDHYGDQVFVGRYIDPTGVNKQGFSIHRHLTIKKCYGFAGQII